MFKDNCKHIKDAIRKTPIIGNQLRRFKHLICPVKSLPYEFQRYAWETKGAEVDELSQVVNLLNYAKTTDSGYPGRSYPAGYHTIRLKDEVLVGQRDPLERLGALGFNFSNKSVLDIGCNQGGMLFGTADSLRWGVGLDFDRIKINACSKISQVNRYPHLSFYTFDIDKDPHELIYDFLPDRDVDCIFLLAVCRWVNKWPHLIEVCSKLSPLMVFESNGSEEQQDCQVTVLQEKYRQVQVVRENEEKGVRRRLLIASN